MGVRVDVGVVVPLGLWLGVAVRALVRVGLSLSVGLAEGLALRLGLGVAVGVALDATVPVRVAVRVAGRDSVRVAVRVTVPVPAGDAGRVAVGMLSAGVVDELAGHLHAAVERDQRARSRDAGCDQGGQTEKDSMNAHAAGSKGTIDATVSWNSVPA